MTKCPRCYNDWTFTSKKEPLFSVCRKCHIYCYEDSLNWELPVNEDLEVIWNFVDNTCILSDCTDFNKSRNWTHSFKEDVKLPWLPIDIKMERLKKLLVFL